MAAQFVIRKANGGQIPVTPSGGITAISDAGVVTLRPWTIVSANGTTAVAGGQYQADTTGGTLTTITLPASASVGDSIAIEDAALTWDTHNLTLARNGLKINSGTSDYTANVIGGKLSIVYISSGVGWSIK